MSIAKFILLLALAVAPQLARAADTSAGKPVSILVGETFSLQLEAGTDCGSLKSNDNISLLVNGMDAGIHPLGCDPATGELSFYLEKNALAPTPASTAAWQTMLGNPLETSGSDFRRKLSYTVVQAKDQGGLQILSAGKLELRMASTTSALIGVALTVGLWISLIVLGRRSGMLRDTGMAGGIPGERTFSLGRFQMAWWFGVVIGSYIFLWTMTGEIPSLSSHALALLGVSGVTGLVSASLDAGKANALPPSSGNFLRDILTDANGITLHRFQMLAMTLILGIMFIFQVSTNLTMPDLDASQLAIMGMAGGTYLGFKIPEKHDAPGGSDADQPASGVEEHKAAYTPGES